MNECILIYKSIEPMGKLIPETKLKYTWQIKVNGVLHLITFYHSKLTNRYQLNVDHQPILKKVDINVEDVEIFFQICGVKLLIVPSKETNRFMLLNANKAVARPLYQQPNSTRYSIDSDDVLHKTKDNSPKKDQKRNFSNDVKKVYNKIKNYFTPSTQADPSYKTTDRPGNDRRVEGHGSEVFFVDSKTYYNTQ